MLRILTVTLIFYLSFLSAFSASSNSRLNQTTQQVGEEVNEIFAGTTETVSGLSLDLISNSSFLNHSNNSSSMNLLKEATELLGSILDDNTYDRTLRPGFKDKPTLVEIDINVRSMGPISETRSIFSMDCYFRQYWTDDRLAFLHHKSIGIVPLSVNALHALWLPDTVFHNGRQSYVHKITVPNKLFRLKKDGSILYSTRLTVKSFCQMHLKRFPMDIQVCSLLIGSFGYKADDVVYDWKRKDGKGVRFHKDLSMSQFVLKERLVRQINVSTGQGNFQEKTSCLQVAFVLKRNIGFYFLQIYLPCYMYVFVSWINFWIDKTATPARVALGIMTLLAATQMCWSGEFDLPRLDYLTALDVFTQFCFLFVFMSLVEYAAVHFAENATFYGLSREEPSAPGTPYAVPKNVQRGGVVARLAMGVNPKKGGGIIVPMMDRKMLSEYILEQLYQHPNSRVDKISRYLFPTFFLLFNLAYWFYYLYLYREHIEGDLNDFSELREVIEDSEVKGEMPGSGPVWRAQIKDLFSMYSQQFSSSYRQSVPLPPTTRSLSNNHEFYVAPINSPASDELHGAHTAHSTANHPSGSTDSSHHRPLASRTSAMSTGGKSTGRSTAGLKK